MDCKKGKTFLSSQNAKNLLAHVQSLGEKCFLKRFFSPLLPILVSSLVDGVMLELPG